MGENSFCSRTICWMEANSCLKLNLILISKMWKIFFCYFMANEGAKSPKQRKKYPTIHRGVKTPIQSLRKACPSWTAACSYTTIHGPCSHTVLARMSSHVFASLYTWLTQISFFIFIMSKIKLTYVFVLIILILI